MRRLLRIRWMVWLAFPVTVFVGAAQVNVLTLLRKTTNPPVPYQCKIVVTTWHGKASDAAGVAIT